MEQTSAKGSTENTRRSRFDGKGRLRRSDRTWGEAGVLSSAWPLSPPLFTAIASGRRALFRSKGKGEDVPQNQDSGRGVERERNCPPRRRREGKGNPSERINPRQGASHQIWLSHSCQIRVLTLCYRGLAMGFYHMCSEVGRTLGPEGTPKRRQVNQHHSPRHSGSGPRSVAINGHLPPNVELTSRSFRHYSPITRFSKRSSLPFNSVASSLNLAKLTRLSQTSRPPSCLRPAKLGVEARPPSA